MAKEMAHQIRTPLIDISGAVQLLRLNLRNSATDIGTTKEREHLCQQILQESIHMDKVIQNFLGYAEFSPSDSNDLIQMDLNKSNQK